MPLTIDCSTCSGVAADMAVCSFRDTAVCCGTTAKVRARQPCVIIRIDDTMMRREMPPKRRYELKKRAEDVAATHRRITEAAIELHGTVGPSRTTLTAVAERAGVERRTLYRHFATEADLFAACSTHYFAANPWPDVGEWRALRDPPERLGGGLDELYASYERTEPMFGNVLRDAELIDFAGAAVAPLQAYLGDAAEALLAGRRARGRRRELVAAALRHAL